MDTISRAQVEAGEIDLRLVAARLWSKRGWIGLSVLLFTAGFAAAAFLMTPIYRAATVVVPAHLDYGSMASVGRSLAPLGGLASLAGVSLDSADSATQEALAVVRSRAFTEDFIRNQGLMPELFRDRWNSQTRTWKGREDTWPTLAEAFKYFDRRVRTVTRDRMTGLITIAIEWRDPGRAAFLANALVAQLNTEMRSRGITEANASIGYLEKELATTSAVETRQAINRLMETQINNRMLANVTQEYAFRAVDPALPPGPRDVVQPNKPLMLALGPSIGLIAGALLVLVAGAATSRARE